MTVQSAEEARTALSVSNLRMNHSFAANLWKNGLAFLSISSRGPIKESVFVLKSSIVMAPSIVETRINDLLQRSWFCHLFA